VRRAWREGLSAFGEVDLTVEELIDKGDWVLAVVRVRGVGRMSEAPVEGGHLAVWTLSEGKVGRLQVFANRQEALADFEMRE
jgi:ketosteroid isomerase-like protein